MKNKEEEMRLQLLNKQIIDEREEGPQLIRLGLRQLVFFSLP